MTEVQPSYDPKMESLKTSLGNLVASGEDMGASITVDIDSRSSTKILSSLLALMLVDRGLLDGNGKMTKNWTELLAKAEDVDNDQGSNSKDLDEFIVEEIAGPLGADFHQKVAVEQQQEGRLKLCLKPLADTQAKSAVLNGHSSNGQINGDHTSKQSSKLYPESIPLHRLHPNACDFSIVDQGAIGQALVTHRSWRRGDFMARFDGITVPEVMLHTLQKTERVHIWDPHFIGCLAHSCNPNTMLDMAEQEIWAIQDIEAGSVLSMDYASTEDHLFRTFQCGCSSPSCRGEVTGRKQRRNIVNGVDHESI